MRSIGVALAGILLLFAACSGDDSSSAEPEPEAQESVEESPSPEVVPVDPAVVSNLATFKAEVDETIKIEGFGDFMTVAAGYVWVGNGATEAIDRIDPATNKIIGSTPGPLSCTGFDSGFGSVWVPSCGDRTVYRIDEKTAEVTAEIKVDKVVEETSIGIGEGGVWLITGEDLLSRIDPKTNKVAETLQVEEDSAGVGVGFGSVWVSSNLNGVVQRIDPKTGRAVASIRVGTGPRFLSVGEDSVWVISQSVGTVSRIDPETDRVVAEIDVGEVFSGGDIAAGDGYVVAATGEGPLSIIDQATNTVTQQWSSHGADALALDGASAWISDHDLQVVYRYSVP